MNRVRVSGMTLSRRVALAFLVALPAEGVNLCLIGMMLDPGPLPAGIFPKLLEVEWVFFHFIGFKVMLDRFPFRIFGVEAGLIAAFVFAYLQTAFVILVAIEIMNWVRIRIRSATTLPKPNETLE